MATLLDRATKRYQEDGFIQILTLSIHFIYENVIRPQSPETTVTYNRIQVRNARLGDSLVPWRTTDIPGYEKAIVRSIREYVERGDRVVIVGGGWGVSTVAAAKRVGDDGSVVTFEGSEKAIKNVEETVNLNNVVEQVSVRHAIVSRAHSLRGEKGEAEIVSPKELPECEVLVLDCEGAETDILDKMNIRPRVLVVETHGMLGASESEIRRCIDQRGYDITDSRVAEARLRTFCEENDIYVLTAVDSA